MINIYTPTVNRPKFIEYQKKTFDKFLLCDYKFYVLDDSSDEKISEDIKDTCLKNNIEHISSRNIFFNRNDPSAAHGSLTQWWYDTFCKNTNQKILYLDSDMFLFEYFNAEEYINKFEIAGHLQKRGHINYLWPGLLFINLEKILDKEIYFGPKYIEGHQTDTGGSLYFWLSKNVNSKIDYFKNTSRICAENNNLHEFPINFINSYKDYFKFEIYMDKFLHYGQGSNWDSNAFRTSSDPKKEKTEYLYYFLDESIKHK